MVKGSSSKAGKDFCFMKLAKVLMLGTILAAVGLVCSDAHAQSGADVSVFGSFAVHRQSDVATRGSASLLVRI